MGVIERKERGRKRDMIKFGGFQIWPSEIEEVLSKHRLIKDDELPRSETGKKQVR